jgi:cytolysin (calcineurin-like family phosphatase)
MKRRSFLKNFTAASAGALFFHPLFSRNPLFAARRQEAFDVTFVIVSDIHAEYFYQDHLQNAYMQSIKNIHLNGKTWPEGTFSAGQPIDKPIACVTCGDLCNGSVYWLDETLKLKIYRKRFEKGFVWNPAEDPNPAPQLDIPCYNGLGNHDLPGDQFDDVGRNIGQMSIQHMTDYIKSQHQGPNAPVPVTSFHDSSLSYSWDWGGLHLIQGQRFCGDAEFNAGGGLDWLREDLATYAADNRPVLIFQHYGFDAFSTDGDWWSESDRTAFKDAIDGYNVIGIVTGHSHQEDYFSVDGCWDNFVCDNAIDGNQNIVEGFMLCRVTETFVDICSCKATDLNGNTRFVAPIKSKLINSVPNAVLPYHREQLEFAIPGTRDQIAQIDVFTISGQRVASFKQRLSGDGYLSIDARHCLGGRSVAGGTHVVMVTTERGVQYRKIFTRR